MHSLNYLADTILHPRRSSSAVAGLGGNVDVGLDGVAGSPPSPPSAPGLLKSTVFGSVQLPGRLSLAAGLWTSPWSSPYSGLPLPDSGVGIASPRPVTFLRLKVTMAARHPEHNVHGRLDFV